MARRHARTSRQAEDWPLRNRTALVSWGVVVLLLATGGILASAANYGSGSLSFIGLLVTSLAALAAVAAVFTGLKLSDGSEAFGLPTGSIRGLLAIGIMMLLVVFGLEFLNSGDSAPERLSAQPLQVIETSPGQVSVDQALQRLEADGSVKAMPISLGRPETDTAQAAPARIAVYGRTKEVSSSELDLFKQLLTAIITLMTTVVGFYFGSRSATEGFVEGAAGASSPGAAASTGTTTGSPSAPALPEALRAEFGQTKDASTDLLDQAQQQEQSLSALIAGATPAQGALKARAEAARTTLATLRATTVQAVEEGTKAVDAALAARPAERDIRSRAAQVAIADAAESVRKLAQEIRNAQLLAEEFAVIPDSQ